MRYQVLYQNFSLGIKIHFLLRLLYFRVFVPYNVQYSITQAAGCSYSYVQSRTV